jgi:hypothetical protein
LLDGDPLRVGLCHCQQCQRRTGSLFGAAAFYADAQVAERRGVAKSWTRTGDSGGNLTFQFCPDCGGTVYWQRIARPGLLVVAVGAFADHAFPTPAAAYWSEYRHDWLELPAEIAQRRGNG